MPPATTRDYSKLRKSIAVLEVRFLKKHLDHALLTVSQDEHVDVSAFVVLAHAAIEGYLEVTAQWLLDRAVENWTKKTRISRATACLLLSCESDSTPVTDGAFDRIRKSLDVAKRALSRIINTENHGISVDHMRKLFVPLGVDVPQDSTLLASLEKLSKERGEKAHRSIGATVVLSAGDAKTMVEDCLKLAERIGKATRDIRP